MSLLLHALLLFFFSRQDLFNQQLPVAEPQMLVVRLNPPSPLKEAGMPPASMLQPTPVPPSRLAREPKIKPPSVTRPDTLRDIATLQAEPMPAMPPIPPAQAVPAPSKPAMPDPAQFPDMMSYVNAVREMRRSSGEDVGRINEETAVRQRGLSEDEVRMANIKRNLQSSGTNGIFQILSLDAHTATFAFRGWKNEFSYSHREVYEVEAGLSGDIQRAVVRKMIEIIRRYYSGDFNWESPRFDRVLVMSARLQDSDGLEDFLLQEFFGSRAIPAR